MNEQLTAYEQQAQPVRAALEAAGIDTRDFGRFVNRPHPGVIEPAYFDAARATPILLTWLPRVSNEKLRTAIVRHLDAKTRDGAIAGALIEEFRRPGSETCKWVIADKLASAATRQHFDTLTSLAADTSHGKGREPLVAMLWRIKTPAADQALLDSITDPATALTAMSALRRRLGPATARHHILPLINHQDERVRAAASRQLRRIDKTLTTST